MTDQPGPGWWQASDGIWYAPETHPDYVPPSSEPLPSEPLPSEPRSAKQLPSAPSLPAPSFEPSGPQFVPPAPYLSAPPPSKSKPWFKQWWVAVLGGLVALFAVAGVAASNSTESGDVATDDVSRQPVAEDSSEDEDASAAAPGSADPSESVGEERSDSPEAQGDDYGTRENPLAYGVAVPVVFDVFGDADNSVWNVTLSAPRDITPEVAAANDFNDPPPDGVVFVGFDVEITLASASKEPLSTGFNFDWELLGGSTNGVYDAVTIDDIFGCGVVENEFDQFAEVFVAGTLSGTVCIPLPLEDLTDPDTQVAMNFRGDRVVFAEGGATPSPASVGTAGQPAESIERGYDATVPVVFNVFGDADGSVWNVKLGPPRDITAEVLDANQFNDPPPDGVIYAGFDAEVTLASASKEPLSTGFNLVWEILGGATDGVYDAGTIGDGFGCGSFDSAFDGFAEVFVGGNISGQVCLPLPIEDLDHPDTRVAINLGGRVLFVEGGETPPPAELEPNGLPGSLPRLLPLSEPAALVWDVSGDADGSIWTTTVGSWRDITAQVLADNQFNDPPPAGAAFVGFDVELTLLEASKEPLSAGFNITWEILGGATLRVYSESSFSDIFGCGMFDDEFDTFAEVFAGGTLTGTICIPMPIEDINHPDTRISLNFDGERVPFGPR